jgi:hypothetical protein
MRTKLTWFEKMMLGVTFAEANMHTAAREYVENGRGKETKRQDRRQCEYPSVNEDEGDAGTARI